MNKTVLKSVEYIKNQMIFEFNTGHRKYINNIAKCHNTYFGKNLSCKAECGDVFAEIIKMKQ